MFASILLLLICCLKISFVIIPCLKQNCMTSILDKYVADISFLSEAKNAMKILNDSHNQQSFFGTKNWNHICLGFDQHRCVQHVDGIKSQMIYAIPQLHVFACLIPKNSNTVIRSIILYLVAKGPYMEHWNKAREAFDRRKMEPNDNHAWSILFHLMYNTTMDTGIDHGSHWDGLHFDIENTKRMHNSLSDATKSQNMTSVENWRLFAVVRNPIYRFISTFIDKCINKFGHPAPDTRCNGCADNFDCFVLTEYSRFMNLTWQKSWKYQGVPYDFEDYHFFPQTWRCDFDELHRKYNFIKYDLLDNRQKHDNFVEKFIHMLKEYENETSGYKIPEDEIRQQLTNMTDHTTSNSEHHRTIEMRLFSKPFLMEFIIRMFYQDFKILGFKLPLKSFMNPSIPDFVKNLLIKIYVA